MPKSQQSCVQSQHPPIKWNLRGGRLSSVEYSTWKKISNKLTPSWLAITYCTYPTKGITYFYAHIYSSDDNTYYIQNQVTVFSCASPCVSVNAWCAWLSWFIAYRGGGYATVETQGEPFASTQLFHQHDHRCHAGGQYYGLLKIVGVR